MISLTFDDALDAHLNNAVPILDAAGLRGTFYAHLASQSLCRRRDDWRGAASSGHEIGNHTVFHPAVLEKDWVTRGGAIDFYTLDRMRMELELANHWLESVDGQCERTFAYPCSNPMIGRHGPLVRAMRRMGLRYTRWPGMFERAGLDIGSTLQSYAPLLPELFVAARGGGLTLEMTAPTIDRVDRYQLPSAACDGHGFEQLREFVVRSLRGGGWAILQFHGVGGGHDMDCALDDFRSLVAWIADEHADRTVTIVEGARRVFGGDRGATSSSKVTSADA